MYYKGGTFTKPISDYISVGYTNPSKFGIRKLRPVTAAINCGGIFRRTLVTWRRDPARQLANTRPPSALRAFLQNQSYL